MAAAHLSNVEQLTDSEIQEMIRFWDTACQNRKLIARIGSEVLLTAVTREPDLLPKFHIFSGLPLRQLAHHKKLAQHGQYVAFTFASIVSHLQNMASARNFVHTVVRNHQPRGIVAEHYVLFFSILLAVLVKRVPPELLTPEMLRINRKGFAVVLAMFKDCLDDLNHELSLPRADLFFDGIALQEVSTEIIDQAVPDADKPFHVLETVKTYDEIRHEAEVAGQSNPDEDGEPPLHYF